MLVSCFDDSIPNYDFYIAREDIFVLLCKNDGGGGGDGNGSTVSNKIVALANLQWQMCAQPWQSYRRKQRREKKTTRSEYKNCLQQ